MAMAVSSFLTSSSLFTSSSSSSAAAAAPPPPVSPPLPLSIRFSSLSLTATRRSLKSSSLFFGGALSQGNVGRPITLPIPRRPLVTVGAATKKPDSAAKRVRQAEKSRICNRARKSEIHTRMKKVFLALDVLKKQSEPSTDEMVKIEGFISEAYSCIDKAVKVGTLHRNTGAHRKSRLARAKKAIDIQFGWYIPVTAV